MSPLLAQVGQNKNGDAEEFVAVFMAIACGLLVIWLIVSIAFLATLSKTLRRCHPQNRVIEPGQVWLNLIPLFNLVWMFITVIRISESLRNEFWDRGWHRRGETYAQGLGIATCVVGIVLGLLPFIVMLVIYWVKIADYSWQLAAPETDEDNVDEWEEHDEREDAGHRRQRDEEYDDLDDRPWDRR